MKLKIKIALFAAGMLAIIGLTRMNNAVASGTYGGPNPIGVIYSSTTNGTNSYSSYTLNTNSPQLGAAFATNIAMPSSLATSVTTNLGYRWDLGLYKEVSLQYTGTQTANSSNTVTLTFGSNDDGSTNVATTLSWLIGVTNTSSSAANTTAVTNMNSVNYLLGAHRYVYLLSIATGAGFAGGTAAQTNFMIAVSPK